MGKTQDTHIYFPLKVWWAIKKLAKANHRSLSAQIVIAVEEHVKREELKNGKQ